jgi:MoaA/NifB/PqqE/SkfB family radical SAM enzyme
METVKTIEIKSRILRLSSSILLGKSNEDEIKQVTRLAIENGLEEFLTNELISISKTLSKGGK